VNSASFCKVLADGVVILHLAFIVFVMLGGILVIVWPRAIWGHLPCVVWGMTVELTGWICPLTPLENILRRHAGQAPYAGDFVIHFIEPVIYPEGLTREIQIILGAAVVLVNVVVYGYIFLTRGHNRAGA